MRLFTNNNCPDEWIIQAFLDNELTKNQLSDFEEHLSNCDACQKRLEERRRKLSELFSSLEIMDNHASIIKKTSVNKKLYFPIWIGIAASVIILISITFFTKSIKDTTITAQDNCEWVLMSNQDFFPELESPNKLYRLKVIELPELNEKGEVTVNYLIKKCDKQI